MRGNSCRAASRSAVLAVLGLLIAVPPASADTLVENDGTAGSYTRYDGGTDATLQGCSTGRRSQNEPSVAVDPRNSTSSSPAPTTIARRSAAARATSGRATTARPTAARPGAARWCPGYPNDTSPLGSQSPTKGSCASAGDPTQAFDGGGRLYYGFICFNRSKPTNGSIYVARYDDDGASYRLTTRVERGTPSVAGLFQDKINITADQRNGNVYVAWARFSGNTGNDVIMFSRSTNGGQTYSKPIRISDGGASEQFADLAVGPDGAVYLTYRIYAGSQGPDSIAIVKSTNGGVSWTRPRTVATITGFESDRLRPRHLRRRPVPLPAAQLRALLEPVGGRRRRQRRARGLERAQRRRPV